MAVASIGSLIDVAEVFDFAKLLTGLALNAVQCILIPANRKFSTQVVEHIRDWLVRYPEMCPILVSIWVFGWAFGLGARTVKPVAKWRDRTCKIAGAHAAAGAAADLYRVVSSSALAYSGQVLPPPSSLLSQERKLLHSLFKLPLFFCLYSF